MIPTFGHNTVTSGHSANDDGTLKYEHRRHDYWMRWGRLYISWSTKTEAYL